MNTSSTQRRVHRAEGYTAYTCRATCVTVSRWGYASSARQLRAEMGRMLNWDSAQHGGGRGLAFPPNLESTGLLLVTFKEDRPKKRMGFTYLSTPLVLKFLHSVLVECKFFHKSVREKWGSFRDFSHICMPVLDHPIKQIVFQGHSSTTETPLSNLQA